MSRNIIITGAAGNLGRAVVDKFKSEGYQVIAVVEPGKNKQVDKADFLYEVDVTSSDKVQAFISVYLAKHETLDAIALLVGGFAMTSLGDSSESDFEKMFTLNFFSAFHLTKAVYPLFEKAGKGVFLFVGARPALITSQGLAMIPYAFSKKLVFALSDSVAEMSGDSGIRSHTFVPSIIDTPPNRNGMPDADFDKWVKPSEIADAMHYAVNNPAIRNTTFKLYGDS